MEAGDVAGLPGFPARRNSLTGPVLTSSAPTASGENGKDALLLEDLRRILPDGDGLLAVRDRAGCFAVQVALTPRRQGYTTIGGGASDHAIMARTGHRSSDGPAVPSETDLFQDNAGGKAGPATRTGLHCTGSAVPSYVEYPEVGRPASQAIGRPDDRYS